MKHISYIFLFVAGMVLAGCQQPELMNQDGQQAKPRVVTVSVEMPNNQVDTGTDVFANNMTAGIAYDASTRLSIAPDGETPHGMELKWEEGDVLMFNFEHDGSYYAVDAPIVSSTISENGRNADFSLEIPTDIPEGAQFNLYAVYQDNKGIPENQLGVFRDNSNEFRMVKYESDNVTLTDDWYRVRPLMWWKQESIVNTGVPEIGTLHLKHAGWMMALHVKNSSGEDMAMPSNVTFEAQTSTYWLWNGYTAEIPTFNPGTETFTIHENQTQRELRFELAGYPWLPYSGKTIAAGETFTVYRWVASDGGSAPAQQVKVASLDVNTDIVLPAREVENGEMYHVFIEWDGTDYVLTPAP